MVSLFEVLLPSQPDLATSYTLNATSIMHHEAKCLNWVFRNLSNLSRQQRNLRSG